MSDQEKPSPDFSATQLVHWPGQDRMMCDKHAEQARGVAQAMGFVVSSTPIDWGVCGNCVNEWLNHPQA